MIFEEVSYASRGEAVTMSLEKIANVQSVHDLIRAAQEQRDGRHLT